MKTAKIGNEVIEHWYSLIASENFSSKEIYASIEGEIVAQKVPGLEISHIDLSEGGLLSEKREYLRMKRERLIFDVCAAPVGVNYFFSYRFYVEPVIVRVWELVAVIAAVMFLFYESMKYIGPFLGPFFILTALCVFGWLMRNAIGMGLRDLDATLLKIPAVGPIYERFFRKDTYYRQDLRMAYGSIVSGIVKGEVESITAAKGVKLIREYSYSPFFGELYAANEKIPVGRKPAEPIA
jgi:hypothetical protein